MEEKDIPEISKSSTLFLIIMLLIFCWISGSMFSLFYGNADLFQRMGAFGVFSGIILMANAAYSVDVEERKRIFEKEKNTRKIDMEAEMFGEPSNYRISTNRWLSECEKYYWRQKKGLVTAEILLLGLATLQWGFGDMIVNILRCGGLSC